MNTVKNAFECIKRVKVSTWIRLIVLSVAVVNAAMQIFGIDAVEFGNETAEKAASVVVLVVTAASAYWKNNSFTEAAQAADEILQTIRRTQK